MNMPWFTVTKPTCRERIGGDHEFEARYEEVPHSINSVSVNGYVYGEELRKLMYYTKYVRNVCIHCGKTIERTDIEHGSDDPS